MNLLLLRCPHHFYRIINLTGCNIANGVGVIRNQS